MWPSQRRSSRRVQHLHRNGRLFPPNYLHEAGSTISIGTPNSNPDKAGIRRIVDAIFHAAGESEPMASNPSTPLVLLAIVFAMLALVLLLAALDQTIVSTALPTIAGELGGARPPLLGGDRLSPSSTIVGPLYGKISDSMGARSCSRAASSSSWSARCCAALSQGMVQLILFRAIQGVGVGGLMSCPSLVGDLDPLR